MGIDLSAMYINVAFIHFIYIYIRFLMDMGRKVLNLIVYKSKCR